MEGSTAVQEKVAGLAAGSGGAQATPLVVDAEAVRASSDEGERAAKLPAAKPISYWKLYSTADPLDWLLVVVGTIGGLGSGVMLPLFSIVFGDFAQAFGTFIPPCFGLPPIPGMTTEAEFNALVAGIALKFTYLAIGALVAGVLQQFCWGYTSIRQTNRLRRRFLAGVLRQDISYFDTQATTGGLLQGLNEDSLAVQQAISDKVGTFLQHMTTFVVGFIIAFTRSWSMTLVLVGCLPFLAGVGFVLTKLTVTLTNKQTEAYTEAGAVVQQSLSQIRTVAANNGEEAAQAEYSRRLEVPQKVGEQQGLVGGAALGSLQFVMFSSYALALFYGSVRVSQGAMTGGEVVNVLFACLMGSFSLGMAAPVVQYFGKGASSGARMFSIIERQPAIDADAPGEEPASCTGALRLQGCSFAYPARPDVQVMKSLSLDVPAGKTVALVGSSGSGKSTVVGLIERFYDPLEGAVLLDGRDIRTLKLSWLRQQVGLVSQEPTLFATTIFENILMGRPGASDKEVFEAARSANAHNFVSAMPSGYQTQVGERGVQLSGGQKQRIAIARAILKNPRVLLLDEATSALDSESEAIVQEALDRMIVGRTTVVVAHRLSTIQNADTIVVMRNGVVVEQGSHAQLLADPTGAYTNLVKLQVQREADKVAEAAEVAEVLASDGRPISRSSIERVVSRRRSLEQQLSGASGGHLDAASLEAALQAEQLQVARKLTSESGEAMQVVVAPGAARPAAALETTAEAPAAANEGAGGAGGAGAGNDKAPAAKVPFSRLLRLNAPEFPWLAVGVASSVVAGGVQPAFAFLISGITTNFYNPDTSALRATASLYCWMFFVIACGVLAFTLAQQYAFAVMGQRLSRRVRQMLFGSMLRQEIGWFDLDENSSGRLASALSSDAAVLRGAVGDVFGVVAQNLATVAVGYTLGFIFDWRMALLVTGAAPLVAVGGYLHIKMTFGLNTSSDKLYATANQAVAEAVAAIRVIQAYNLQGRVAATYAGILHEANERNRSTALVGGISLGYSQFVMLAMYGLITWFGGLELTSCRATFDEFLKAFFCVLFAAMGLAQAQVGFPDIGKAKAALARVFPILDRTPAIDSAAPGGEAPDPRALRGELELRRVVFRYPNRPEVAVFNNFSLVIGAGKTVALVGESGSGKSTVVGLIERFYDPLEGAVLLDGRDLRQYNLRWLRQQIGLVSQEPLLFAGSVLDNIRYGAPSATLAEVEAAARAANAHDFVSSLPDGYGTQVGEQGVQLSGGQKQRIAIARAVVKAPRILLLDEATSALDAASERLVQEALDRIMAGRTSVIVAHRLSTIQGADTIAVVFRGVILEQGTHAELLAIPGGGYSRLVAAQMKGKQQQQQQH